MKLQQGERIVCSKGHQVGDVLTDVPDDEPVPTEALSITYVPDRGYACGQCDEVVAERKDENRWRVRTARGWVS